MKVRAAVLRSSGGQQPYAESRPLGIEEVELGPPGRGEVCVRILAAGLCHSDLSVINGSRPRPLPMVLGHEAAGEIVELGEGVEDLSVGDPVVFSFVPICGHCEPCATGRPALCERGASANAAGELLAGGRRWKDTTGQPLRHHLGVSAFADYVVASSRSVVRVDSDLSPEIAALFGCAVLTGVGAIVNTAKVSPGESVAIFGLGGVGLASLLGARCSGAYPVIAVDVNPEKLALAVTLGAHHALDARSENLIETLRQITQGGVHYAIESVGNEGVLAQAYSATRRGGTTISIGLAAPDRTLSIPSVSLVAEERTIKGSYMGSSVPSRDLPRFVALYRAGLLPVDRLLTHRLRLEDLNEGFDRLARGEAVRQIVKFDSISTPGSTR
jgi:Zn-dependent alcohol dehydrogenase